MVEPYQSSSVSTEDNYPPQPTLSIHSLRSSKAGLESGNSTMTSKSRRILALATLSCRKKVSLSATSAEEEEEEVAEDDDDDDGAADDVEEALKRWSGRDDRIHASREGRSVASHVVSHARKTRSRM